MTEYNDYDIGKATAAVILGLTDNKDVTNVAEVAEGVVSYTVDGMNFATVIDPTFEVEDHDDGVSDEYDDGLIFSPAEVSLVRSLLCVVARSPEASKLAQGIDELLGEQDEEAAFRFKVVGASETEYGDFGEVVEEDPRV